MEKKKTGNNQADTFILFIYIYNPDTFILSSQQSYEVCITVIPLYRLEITHTHTHTCIQTLQRAQEYSSCLYTECITMQPLLHLCFQLLAPSISNHIQSKFPTVFQRQQSSSDFAFAITAVLC